MSPQQAPGQVGPMNTVGHNVPRIDAYERVTGRATYTGDVRLPGMLYARVLRSPHPHARIRSIDVSRAEGLPGVRAVVTHETHELIYSSGSIAGGRQYNDAAKDITEHVRYMFDNPVRFVGQPVAAVAAVNRHVAEEALQLIEIDYEELPFVLDLEEALEPGAPPIWPEGNLALDFANQPRPSGGTSGDPEAGFRAADQVFEDRYTTAFVQDAQMEPRSALAQWEGDKVTIYTPTQGISNCRHDNARDLGLEDHQVQIICKYMGGGFGDKNGSYYFDLIAAMLAKDADAPVLLELTRKDDWLGTHGRWHTVQDFKVGVTQDGTVTAIQMHGYSGMGPYLRRSGGIGGIDAYGCPNVERVIYPGAHEPDGVGEFPGTVGPPGLFRDPVDDGRHRVQGGHGPGGLRAEEHAEADGAGTVHELLARGVHRTGSRALRLGEPLASGARFGPRADQAWRRHGVHDVPIRCRPEQRDPPGEFRGTVHAVRRRHRHRPRREDHHGHDRRRGAGRTVVAGGSRLGRYRPLPVFGGRVGEPDHDDDGLRGRSGCPGPQGPDRGERDAARRRRADRLGDPDSSTQGRRRMCFGAHFVEVEADVQLGHVRITKYVAVHESGRILNPLPAKDQIRGAAIQGIGQALHEDLLYDPRNGHPLTAGYYGARHLTHMDVPEIEVTFIQTDDGYGPYGAKTVGEAGIILGPAAVANAIFNAIGHRMKDLPITREKILEALA